MARGFSMKRSVRCLILTAIATTICTLIYYSEHLSDCVYRNAVTHRLQMSSSNGALRFDNVSSPRAVSVTDRIVVLRDEVIMPGGGKCASCLEGKQLVTVQKGWICSHPRLGNKMFMLLPAITAAAQYNATLILFTHTEDCDWMGWLQDIFEYFNSSTPLLPYSLTQDWPDLDEPIITGYTSENYKEGANFTFSGYRQSWKYLQTKRQEEAVRKVFKLTAKYDNYALRTIAKARREFNNIENALLVGVHMRIGDLQDLDYGYQMAGTDFYKIAMASAHRYLKTDNIIFLVASDTLTKSKQVLSNFSASYNIFFVSGSPVEDFATLSKCDHSVMSGGTFGFWAAWLAGGQTFYHANYVKPDSKLAEGFKTEDFYFPHWIPINTSDTTLYT